MAVVSSTSVRRRRRAQPAISGRGRWVTALDWMAGFLILATVVLAPWLFGCTEPWSIAVVNSGALGAGACSLAIFFLDRTSREPDDGERTNRRIMRLFLASNICLLVFCLIAWLNARASFSIDLRAFNYRTGVISWLPTSYDRDRTLQFLINSLAFFSIFWTVRAWVRRGRSIALESPALSFRMKLLLWAFAVNGFLVALQGLLQRLSNSSELLWIRPSYWGVVNDCFGPFSYRGNAADYLNLVWPATFGFWYVLVHRRARRPFGIGDGPELTLLPMFLITAGASFATLSRGGTIVGGALMIALLVAAFARSTSRFFKLLMCATCLAVVLFALLLSGSQMVQRFRVIFSDKLSGRTEIYENARQIASDFPLFGTGPGTFLSVYHMYRADPAQGWAAFLHDDWLETRVTFGIIGMSLVLLQLALFFAWVFWRRKIPDLLTTSLGLSVVGCLIHAKGDFPFQTYGVTFTFIVVCALLTLSAERSVSSNERH